VGQERFTAAVAVYGLLVDVDRLLLVRRAGSGYHDGEFSLPAGHLDGGESAVAGLVRELREEVMVDADRRACRMVLVAHRAPELLGDREYVDLFFSISSWSGRPSIGEPDKCSELVWADRDDLPVDTAGFIVAAVRAIDRGEPLLLWGWDR
jgi:8-oxo-dGTP pyrophosphatase MutT (NUDIX family)